MRDLENAPGFAFRKMHGLGNDFVVIDARGGRPAVTPSLVRAIGDRHHGVGFDQLAVIGPDRESAGEVIFWNTDGSTAGACGNATRCVADLLMRESGADHVVVRTQAGLLSARRGADGRVTVDMGPAETDWRVIPLARAADPLRLPILGEPTAVSMGNPHCVFFVDDVASVVLEDFGPQIECHPLFPARTNVEICEVKSPSRMRMRVWERGAGITLACGSGACAAAVAGHLRGLTGREVAIELDGGVLDLEVREDGHVLMTGPVAYVFEGRLSPEFIAAFVP
ncbi:MAG: diaminopimelate epimerase [Paracoccaceae bacterium]